MKESLILSFLVIFIYIFFFFNRHNKVLVESNNSGKKFLVNNDKYKKEAANMLAEIIERLYKLKNHLVENKDKYSDYKEYIDQLNNNFKETRTSIYENPPSSGYTSYSVNKGEELAFCLKSKKTGDLHDKNLIMYVALHEMSHIACPEVGHTELFKKIFVFLTEIAVELNLYRKDDYDNNPVEYCGMILSSSII